MRNKIEKWIVENSNFIYETIYFGIKSVIYVSVTIGLMYLILIFAGYV